MPKPILIIKVDNSRGIFAEHYEMQRFFSDKYDDYHVLVVPFEQAEDSLVYEPIQIQVFHEKDFTEIDYKKLKSMIENSIPANQDKTK